jgi:hypothetical protein
LRGIFRRPCGPSDPRSARKSGCRSDLVVTFGRTRSARAAARTTRFLFGGFRRFRLVAADRRREDIERNGLAAPVHGPLGLGGLAPGTIITVVTGTALLTIVTDTALLAGTTLVALVAARPVAAVEPLAAVLPLRAILAILAIVGRSFFARLDQFILALILVDVVIALTALLVLILEARTAFAQHAEIVIGELQIIFGLDTVTRQLGITRHALVFLKKLRGIAALPIVLPISRLSAEILAPLPTTAAPAAALSIVDQMPTSLRSV